MKIIRKTDLSDNPFNLDKSVKNNMNNWTKN